MDECGQEFARRFQPVNATKVLTAEISGIAPAITTGLHLGLPVVYAASTNQSPCRMKSCSLSPLAHQGRMVELIISPEYLAGGERVLIIDDFLATGATINGLVRLAHTAGAVIVGIGALIEKKFEGGRDSLAYLGIPIESLVCIESMEDDAIQFAVQ